MTRVVFDIETLGVPFDTLDEVQRDYLLKSCDTEEKRQAEMQRTSLYPLTAQIIAIGMYNPDSKSGKVFYQADTSEQSFSADRSVEFSSGDEAFVIRSFWDAVQRYDQFVTFNGRGFDCPFIMLRSAILGIPATRNLVPYRYDSQHHFDLLEQLTFYGAVRKFNLDFYCRAFGIRSSKIDGITGADLGPVFREKRFKEIAEYCLRDIIATSELYLKWKTFLSEMDRTS